MSNPFADDNSDEILEGFLCPICREDLKSFEFLTDHFERSHAEDQDALTSVFKNILSKARRKIKSNFDDSSDLPRGLEKDASISGSSNSGASNCMTDLNVYNFMEYQEVGAERSHFSYFEKIRNPRLERYATETDKLIIRLHKLLKDMPIDPVLRKQHEKNTVTWLDGSSVKLCPNCAKSFYIARRQHHCRLCGSIMCNECSQFLSIENAFKLACLTISNVEGLESTVSLHKEGLRTCEFCLRLLETRNEMLESRINRSPITIFYSEIQQLRNDITPDIEMYIKIIDSLYSGETVYTISDASELRGKIGKVAEAIDNRSKRILAISCEQGSREQSLQKAVRISSIQFIKEKMLSTPPLPAEEEIRKIQDRKRMETEMRIETERRQALEAYERYGLGGTGDAMFESGNTYASGSAVHTLNNWTSHQNNTSNKTIADDPFIEQMNIVKGYIKQARDDKCFDVVEALEANLQELQMEFYQRHKLSQQEQVTKTESD